tara:strand:- start:2486 stop:3037 length:552 start_codon:yes stop_codon:yes gene_type:complete
MFANYCKNLRENEETSRAGLKWTDEEDEQLMKYAIEGMVLDDVALKHHRTVGSIKIRVMSNGLNMMTDKNLTLEEVSNMIHISEEELGQYKHKWDEDKKQKLKSRVMSTGLKMMTDKNLTLAEVSNLIDISEEELFQYKQQQDEKKSKRKLTPSSASYDATITQDIVSILSEIRDYLKIISEK